MKQFFFSLIVLALMLITTQACSQKNTNNADEKKPAAQLSELLAPAEFLKKLKSDGGILIDVRTPQETNKGIIEGATLLNLFDDNFELEINKLDKEKTYFVYCGSGGRSAETAELMLKKGFKHVIDLDGGYMRWKKENMPTVMPN